jgi:hypothetical protein
MGWEWGFWILGALGLGFVFLGLAKKGHRDIFQQNVANMLTFTAENTKTRKYGNTYP